MQDVKTIDQLTQAEANIVRNVIGWDGSKYSDPKTGIVIEMVEGGYVVLDKGRQETVCETFVPPQPEAAPEVGVPEATADTTPATETESAPEATGEVVAAPEADEGASETAVPETAPEATPATE